MQPLFIVSVPSHLNSEDNIFQKKGWFNYWHLKREQLHNRQRKQCSTY